MHEEDLKQDEKWKKWIYRKLFLRAYLIPAPFRIGLTLFILLTKVFGLPHAVFAFCERERAALARALDFLTLVSGTFGEVSWVFRV